MKSINHTLRSIRLLILLFAILPAVNSVHAQDRMWSVLTDPRMVVIPVRSLEEIRNDNDNAEAAKQLATYREAQANNRLKEIERAIEIRKTALKVADLHKDDAKKGKRDSEVIALQIESKANQQAINLLDRLKDLRKAEIDESQVEAELADIEIRMLQMENELQRKRMEYDSLSMASAGDLTLITNQQILRELEVRLLKLQEEQANSTQKLASKQKDVVARRKQLHEAQLKLGMPRI